MKKKKRLAMIFVLCGALLFTPAAGLASALGGAAIPQGLMLHALQVLERYDAAGEPLLQYVELWADVARVTQREVGEDGKALSWSFSGPQGHLSWAPDTLKAVRLEESKVFLLDYTALKTGFDIETTVPGQVYAGRSCSAVLLKAPDNEKDWLKFYLDDETGFVLFCEAPLFRLRTALLETLPMDESRLTPPDGLLF